MSVQADNVCVDPFTHGVRIALDRYANWIALDLTAELGLRVALSEEEH